MAIVYEANASFYDLLGYQLKESDSHFELFEVRLVCGCCLKTAFACRGDMLTEILVSLLNDAHTRFRGAVADIHLFVEAEVLSVARGGDDRC